jgi:hypothetical protein
MNARRRAYRFRPPRCPESTALSSAEPGIIRFVLLAPIASWFLVFSRFRVALSTREINISREPRRMASTLLQSSRERRSRL